MLEAKASVPLNKITIETDGTAKGTIIRLNGQVIENLTVFRLCLHNDGLPNPLSVSFTTKDPNPQPGSLTEMHQFSLVPAMADTYASTAGAAARPAGQFMSHFAGPQAEHPSDLQPRTSGAAATQNYAEMFDGNGTNEHRRR